MLTWGRVNQYLTCMVCVCDSCRALERQGLFALTSPTLYANGNFAVAAEDSSSPGKKEVSTLSPTPTPTSALGMCTDGRVRIYHCNFVLLRKVPNGRGMGIRNSFRQFSCHSMVKMVMSQRLFCSLAALLEASPWVSTFSTKNHHYCGTATRGNLCNVAPCSSGPPDQHCGRGAWAGEQFGGNKQGGD